MGRRALGLGWRPCQRASGTDRHARRPAHEGVGHGLGGDVGVGRGQRNRKRRQLVDGALAGVVAVADPVKASSPAAISRLRDMGITVVMLTGDHERTARAVAAAYYASREALGFPMLGDARQAA